MRLQNFNREKLLRQNFDIKTPSFLSLIHISVPIFSSSLVPHSALPPPPYLRPTELGLHHRSTPCSSGHRHTVHSLSRCFPSGFKRTDCSDYRHNAALLYT
ncbi:hypothetical protein QVD17_21640 [Tagetes erecta]|uniref:Uncharacterized protein n=1 Tax=Tagetes erecta TaxID=13708 RepID=A0AAD8KFQ4_TARER|nr:hypothetical protein QVD17_21640 [Tagetes erecta]